MVSVTRGRTRYRGLARAILCGALVALSGCKAFVKEEPPPCPRVSILGDALKQVHFRPGPGRDVTDIEWKAEIKEYRGACFYDKSQQLMTVTLNVGIDIARGPALADGAHQLAYFIAVPEYFPLPEAKKTVPLTAQFDRNVTALHLVDHDVSIAIPVKNVKEMERDELFLGLQLDEAELQYNRTHSGRH